MDSRNNPLEVGDQVEDETYLKFRYDMRISDLKKTLRYARIRCLAFEEILHRLERIWEYPEYSEVIAALGERELSILQEKKLVQVLIGLSQVGDQLDTKNKIKVDRTLARVSKLLSRKAACEVIVPFLDHRRKARRALVYQVLKSVPIPAKIGQKFIDRHKQTGEDELLELVARSPEATLRVDARYLLSSISDKYWRARVLATLIGAEPQLAYKFAYVFPYEFVHAIGRVRHKEAINIMKRLFKKHRSDIEFLSIYAWCLGVLGARKDLATVELAFADLERKLSKVVGR
jgi:hypothetical protein